MEIAWHLLPDSLLAWMARYQQMAVVGVRSPAVTGKIALHLDRFLCFFRQTYGHERISTCLKRDVLAWQARLREQGLAPATINNHLASLSAFTTWVHSHAPRLFPAGDPAKGIGELALPPLEPRALTERQIVTLKNLCDRLDWFYHRKGRRWTQRAEPPPLRLDARPLRDRAIVFVLLSTGLRREELIQLNLTQLSPQTPASFGYHPDWRVNVK